MPIRCLDELSAFDPSSEFDDQFRADYDMDFDLGNTRVWRKLDLG